MVLACRVWPAGRAYSVHESQIRVILFVLLERETGENGTKFKCMKQKVAVRTNRDIRVLLYVLVLPFLPC